MKVRRGVERQLLTIAVFDDTTAFENENLVRPFDGRQAVSDDDTGASAQQDVNGPFNHPFSSRVNS